MRTRWAGPWLARLSALVLLVGLLAAHGVLCQGAPGAGHGVAHGSGASAAPGPIDAGSVAEAVTEASILAMVAAPAVGPVQGTSFADVLTVCLIALVGALTVALVPRPLRRAWRGPPVATTPLRERSSTSGVPFPAAPSLSALCLLRV